MPAAGAPLTLAAPMLSTAEVERLVRPFVGVEKVGLTGGEPLVRKNAVDVLALVRQSLAGKHAAHAGLDRAATAARPMVTIGG
jgi:molybdenum cofactor biosynthesis enzyme MoaA